MFLFMYDPPMMFWHAAAALNQRYVMVPLAQSWWLDQDVQVPVQDVMDALALALSIRYDDWKQYAAARTLGTPTACDQEVFAVAGALLEQLQHETQPLVMQQLLGIAGRMALPGAEPTLLSMAQDGSAPWALRVQAIWALARFDGLNAALRKQGIYLMFSAHWSRSFMPGVVPVRIAGVTTGPWRSPPATSLAPPSTASLIHASTRSASLSRISGPTSVASSAGSPATSLAVSSTTFHRKVWKTRRSTKTRCASSGDSRGSAPAPARNRCNQRT